MVSLPINMTLWDSKTVDLMIYVLSPKNVSCEKLRHHVNRVVCSNKLKMIQLLTSEQKRMDKYKQQ